MGETGRTPRRRPLSAGRCAALLLLQLTASSQGLLTAQEPLWSTQPVARIGSADDPEQALTRVSAVLIDSRFRVLVIQPQDREIAVFDSTGRRIRTIGRSGEGPGEFDALSAAGLRGDTLYVADNALGRISFFDADGEPLSTLRFASPPLGTPPAFYFPTVPQVLLPDGSGLVRPEVPIALLSTGSGRVPYLRVSPSLGTVDTLAWEDLPTQTFEILSDGNRFSAARPFPDRPLLRWLADGSGLVIVERRTATASAPAFRVTKIGIDGDTAFSRSVAYEPARLDRSRLESAISVIEAGLSARRNAPRRAAIVQTLQNLDLVPTYLPPITDVASAHDGSIWLHRDVANAGANWLVLGPTGESIGQLRLPPKQRVMAVREGVVAALELDSLDVPYIVLHRLRR